MSVTIVQQTAASTSAASVVVPLTTAVQSGDTLIASVCMVGGASVASITDTLGGRWIQTARSYQSDAGTELWTARGHAPIVTDNLVGDSNLTYAIGAVGPTWTVSGTIGIAAGDINVLNGGTDSAEWVIYGAVSDVTGTQSDSAAIAVVPGSTYTLSGNVNMAAATAGFLRLGVLETLGANPYVAVNQNYGTAGVVSISFTVPSGVTQLYVQGVIVGVTIPSGDTISWSQIQLTETSTVQTYEPGPLWTYPVYREAGGTYGLIGTTTALAFEDTGTAIVIPQTVVPRGNNELVVAACSTNASVGVPDGSYTALSMTGGTNFAAAYNVLTTNLSPMLTWPTDAASSWATVQAAFLPGASGLNPDLQFPETSVQICTQTNWQAPFSGAGIWTELAPYVQGFTAGPIGRQHELDRVQAAPANITLDNRTGVFNPWNTESFIYDNGSGMKPMNPIKITAAWNGITYPVYYGYFQSLTNTIKDVLNVEATLACIDILQILSLKYLASDNYAQLVKSDGGTNLEAYYRLGDAPGSYSVQDSSGYGRTGSLINGLSGEPLWGQAGVYLYDPTTALDLTNGANVANGGFTTTDNTTQPPTVYEPLGSAADWSFECWAKMVGSVAGVGTGVDFSASVNAGSDTVYTPAVLPIGSVTYIYNNDSSYVFPMGTFVASVGPFQSSPGWYPYVLTQDALATGQMQGIGYPGGAGAALFSASATGGDISIRVGPYLMGPNPVNGYLMIGVAGNGPTLPLTQLGAYAYIGNTLDGNWHHICVQVSPEPSPTGVTRIFIDGVLVSSQPNPATTTFADPTGITVGCDGDPHNGLPAWLQDVALYSEFLTGAQVQRHYEVGKWFQAIELGAANGAAHEARLNKVLAVSGLDPSTMLAVPNNVPFKTYLYAETNPVTTTSGLNYMQTTSETEPALIFQGPTGIISAYGRQYQYLADNAVTSQGIFGDNVSTATYHYEGTTLTMTQDDLDVFNDIQVQSGRGGYQAGAVYVPPGGIQGPTSGANAGGGQLEEWGPSQSALMAQSASTYGDRTLQGLTSLQFEYDSDALAVAQNYGVWYRDPIMRIETMTLNSYSDNGVNIPQILGRGLYDRITVQYQGQVAGPQFSQESLIESISHSVTISSGPVWASTLALSPYEILMAPTILGTFTFGGTSANGVLTL